MRRRTEQPCLSGCPSSPLLLAPGGNARLKAQALGDAGRDAVRAYLARGGSYLGFCGGAGLALSQRDTREGLHICPWSRAAYPERLHHLISGHVQVRAQNQGESALLPAFLRDSARARHLSLPVWWPGRFAPEQRDDVSVLAAYAAPDSDFWLADLPLQGIPAQVFEAWQALYGVNLSADFLTDQPLVISGSFGKGRYVLSYSHLETPESPDANAWLAHLLRVLTGLAPGAELIPAWNLREPCAAWANNSSGAPLLEALRMTRALLDLAVEHNLFFERAPWLWGWRAGLPGAACNNLHAALCTAVSPCAQHGRAALLGKGPSAFRQTHALVSRRGRRVSAGLPSGRNAGSQPAPGPWTNAASTTSAKRLFGHAMHGGGLVEELLTIAEELIYLSQDADEAAHDSGSEL